MGIDQVIADVLPGDKATRVAELQAAGKKVAMVGDGVNDAPALAQADLGIAIGAGTDVAIETADVVLMRSDPLDIVSALTIGRATVRKMRQNLAWAVGYNTIALPIAAGVFVPAFDLMLRPEIAALSMSGSSFLVALNALLLKRLHLPEPATDTTTTLPVSVRADTRQRSNHRTQSRRSADDGSSELYRRRSVMVTSSDAPASERRRDEARPATAASAAVASRVEQPSDQPALPVAKAPTSSNSVVNGTTLPFSSLLKTTLRLNNRW
jgi:haloacid dehalogenase-like hydrolase